MRGMVCACVARYAAVLVLAGALLVPLLTATGVRAANQVVTTLSDAPGHTGTSLRDAIAAATSGSDVITFQSSLSGTILLEQGTLYITASLTIQGPGATVITIDGGCQGCDPGGSPTGGAEVFEMDNGASLTLVGLRIQHGNAMAASRYQAGGGIINLGAGTLTVANCIFDANIGYQGAAIENSFSGTLTVTNSTFSGNLAAPGYSPGGSIAAFFGRVSIANSTFIGNPAGALLIGQNVLAAVTNSTFSGNSGGNGGAIQTLSPLTVTNSTIAGNTAGVGGGIYVDAQNGGALTIGASIVAGNTGRYVAPDIGGATGSLSPPTITSSGYNLIGDANGATGYVGTDRLNVSPALGPLRYNGGATQTMAPALNSPAVDAIPPANCAVTTDQRGTPRPQGTNCDIGAVEVVPPALVLSNASGMPGGAVTFSGAGFRAGLALTIDGATVPVTSVASDGYSFTATVPNHANGAVPMTVTNPGGAPANATFTYTGAAVTGITIAPVTATIAKGQTQQYTATATFSDTTTQDVTSGATWSSSDPGVAPISNAPGSRGLATGVLSGTATATTITATLNGVTSTPATLSVTAPALANIAVTPGGAGIAKGQTQQFTATGTYSDGSTRDLTASVTWQSSNPGVATIAATGTATGVDTGTTSITAASGPITSPGVTLAVSAATLSALAVTPASASIAKGASQQYTAIGTFTDGTTADLTSSVTWASSNAGVATVSNAAGSHGLATAVAPGTATITAVQGGVTSNNATLTVAKTLQSIAVTPANPGVKVGATVQLAATGTYSDGTTQDLTAQAQWQTSDANIASVDANGKVLGKSPGTVTVTATVGGVTGSARVAVGSGSGGGISPAPAPAPRSGGMGDPTAPPAPAPAGR
jgi:uncharacterized protein YjdB